MYQIVLLRSLLSTVSRLIKWTNLKCGKQQERDMYLLTTEAWLTLVVVKGVVQILVLFIQSGKARREWGVENFKKEGSM